MGNFESHWLDALGFFEVMVNRSSNIHELKWKFSHYKPNYNKETNDYLEACDYLEIKLLDKYKELNSLKVNFYKLKEDIIRSYKEKAIEELIKIS